ncbi:MAG: succinyl-diaminopimelate desuccinylase [Salinisphaera sp.]|nr:succinyl-diaminopimelate desuccinylase [Salinisphaera sp.]
MLDPTLELACALIERRSVTPDDAGCQALVADRLKGAGFVVEHMRFGAVDNLWAVAGSGDPLLCFVGHTDVVPPGPAEDWTADPFQPRLADGRLIGRGAADMKGSVAAMVTAAERFRARAAHHGRLAFLLTSDEEGPAVDGTRRVVETLGGRGEQIHWCVVGEPSCRARLGDTIKHGRRGSLTGRVTVRGRQGHVAYPQAADNALHRLLPFLHEVLALRWDQGDSDFPPTSLQISNLQAGTGADNVIPGQAQAVFNLRYNPAHSAADIRQRIDALGCAQGLTDGIHWHLSGEPFLTAAGAVVDAVRAATLEVTGITPELSTAGGTSDGRFIAPTGAQVVEIGPVNASIHQVDEWVDADDLVRLSRLYEGVMRRLLNQG